MGLLLANVYTFFSIYHSHNQSIFGTVVNTSDYYAHFHVRMFICELICYMYWYIRIQ